ncbi:MAG: PGF-CTERM sorting domain-containing protein [Haloferacaceae archaeon]
MRRERTLAAAAAVVATVAVVTAALVPGALADPTDEGPVRPGPVELVELPISQTAVTGETVTLRVEARLAHRGNPTPNVTVRFRAVDADSGLVATTRTVDVGDVSGDREVSATANLTVERQGGYRIEAVAFADGERMATGARTVSNLGALTPPYARSTVRFTDRTALPPVSVSVDAVRDDRATLNVSASLVNGGDEPVGDLRVTVVLRQAESNLVAARRTVEVGRIRPGRTAGPTVSVTVPNGYNYYVDATLVRDGVVLDTARGVANLDPQRTIQANATTRDVELDVSDFTPEGGKAGADRPRATEGPITEGGGPGLGVPAALAGLLTLAAVALAGRWGR